MSIRSVKHTNEVKNRSRSPLSQNPKKQYIQQNSHSLASVYSPKGSNKNNYLQQQYFALKDKLKTVEHQNAVILKKIKSNMIAVYQSEEDTFCQENDVHTMKLTLPIALQRTQLSDDNEPDSGSCSNSYVTSHFQAQSQESFFLPVIQKTHRTLDQINRNTKDEIARRIEIFDCKVQSKMGTVNTKVKSLELKFHDLLSLVQNLKNLHLSNKLNMKDREEINNHKIRQSQLLIQDYVVKIRKLTSQNQILEQKLLKKQQQIEQKNKLIDKLQGQYQYLSSKYNEILGQTNLEKMKLSHKMIQITNDKNIVIENLERKLENLTMSASMYAINSTSLIVSQGGQNRFRSQIQRLKEELKEKIFEIDYLKSDFAELRGSKESLANSHEEKSQEISKISYQLKESQLMTKKAQQMFEELQKQYKELELKKLAKQSEYGETIRRVKQNSKKKIAEMQSCIFQLSQTIIQILQRLPKKIKKSYDYNSSSSPVECLKILNKVIISYQQKQNKLAKDISEKLNISMIQIQINGVDSVIQKLRKELDQKNKKLAELDQNMHQMNIQKIRSKRDLSPINSIKKISNFPSPKSQNSIFFIEQQLNQKKKEISQLKQQLSKRDHEIQFHQKKLSIVNQQKQQLVIRFDQQKIELKKATQEKQAVLLQKQLIQREQRQDFNKSSSAKAFLQVRYQKLSQKNIQLARQTDKLQRKIQSLQLNAKNHQSNLSKAKEDFKFLQKNLRQQINERKVMISTLTEERSKLKAQILALNSKVSDTILKSQKQLQKKSQQEKKQVLDREVSQLKKHLQQQQKLIKNFEHKNRLMSKRKEEAQNDLKASHSINKLLQCKKGVQIDELKKQLTRLKGQKQQIAAKHAKQLQRLEKKSRILYEEKSQLEKQRSGLQKQLKEIKSKLKGQREKILQKNQQLQHSNEQIKILQGKLNEANIMNNQLIRINRNIQEQGNNEKEEIENKNRSLQRELSNLRAELQKQQLKISELKSVNCNKEQQLNEVRLNYQLLKNSIKQQAKQKCLIRDKAQEDQKQLRESLNCLQQQNLGLQIKLSHAETKIQKLGSQICETECGMSKMKALLDQKQHQILVLIRKNNDLKYSLMDDLDNKSEYIRQIRTQYTGQLQFLQEKYNFLEKQNITLKNDHQKLKQAYQLLLNDYNQSTIKLRNFQNLLNSSKEELNCKNRQALQILRKLQDKEEQVIRINNECSLLKTKNEQLLREIKQDRQNNVEFIKDLDIEHREEAEMLNKKIKKQDSLLKQMQSKLLLCEGSLKQRELDCQILEGKIITEKKWREDLFKELQKKSLQIEQLKAKSADSDQNKSNNHIGEQKCQKSSKQLVYGYYVSLLRKEVSQIASKQKFDFSSEFVRLHDVDAAYQLSLFKKDLISRHIQHSFMQELEFADTNGFEFVSRIEDQLEDVVARLQINNEASKSNNEEIENLKATVKTYQNKVQQLREIREKKDIEFQGMNDFYLRQIKSMREQNVKMSDAMVNIEKLIERILSATIGQEPRILQLKQSFQKMDDIFQEVRGGSIINFDRYRQAYISKSKQFQRSKSKRKGWF